MRGSVAEYVCESNELIPGRLSLISADDDDGRDEQPYRDSMV